MRLAQRLAITLLVPIAFGLLAFYLPPPGIEVEFFDALKIPRGMLGPLALGVTPAASAYVLVEVVAAIVPGWRRLRHGGPKARQKLERAVPVVMLTLAIFQAFGVVLYVRGLAIQPLGTFEILPGVIEQLVFGLGLVAGSCAAYLAARWVTAAGLANGVVLLLLTRLPSTFVNVTKPETPELAGRDIAVAASALALSALATVVVMRRVRSFVPIPASSMQPFVASSAVFSIPALLSSTGLTSGGVPSNDGRAWVTSLVVTTFLALLLAYSFQRPARVAVDLRITEERARAELLRALPATLFFLVVLVFAEHALLVRHVSALGVANVVIATAVVLDLVGAVRAHATPNLVHVGDEHRPHFLMSIERAFESEKLELRALQRAQHVLFRIFGPYVPTGLWVRTDDAARARELLQRIRRGELELPAPERTPQKLPALAIVALVSIGVAFVPRVLARTPGVTKARLEVVRVDDSVDPFVHAEDEALPQGVTIASESAPLGHLQQKDIHYARIVLDPKAPIDAWLRKLTPNGHRIALGLEHEVDPDTGASRSNLLRTYVLTGEPILDNSHVESAEAVSHDMGAAVSIRLSDTGAQRFADATREWTKRRIAILVDDRIVSAPVVLSEIAGGQVQITMGASDPETQLTEAKKLAGALTAQ